MIDFLDFAIFLFLTSFAFAGLLTISIAKRPQAQQLQLKRDPLKIKVSKKNGNPGTTEKLDRWFIQLLRRANIRIDRITVVLLIACSGFTAAAICFVAELPTAIVIAAWIGASLACFAIYYMLMLRRLQKFSQQFPPGLELMARATRAGESLELAFEIAGRSSEEPLKGEFDYCRRQLELGLPIEDVTSDLAQRIGSKDLKLFAHTVGIHRVLGGNLAGAFERLSIVVRKRAESDEKLKSMTGLGRFAVIAIVVLGGLALSYLVIVEPEYIGRLTQSDLGNKLIVYAVFSELIGLAWIGWALKSST